MGELTTQPATAGGRGSRRDPGRRRTDDHAHRYVTDGEGRELRSLIDRANVGNIFECALEHRTTDGVEAELQAHFKLAANSIPLAMLETRAVTPAPSDVGQNMSAIIPGVFPASAAAFLSVDMPDGADWRQRFSGFDAKRDCRHSSGERRTSRDDRIV